MTPEELMRRDIRQLNTELDRWRHGQQIEGDYVCEYSLRLYRLMDAVETLLLCVELESGEATAVQQLSKVFKKLREEENGD